MLIWSSFEATSLDRWLLWRLLHWSVHIFESLGILGLLSLIRGHCLTWAHDTNLTIDCVGRFEDALLAFLKRKVALVLLRAFLLEVLPDILLDLGALLLHLNLVLILEGLHLFSFLLSCLVRIVSLHSKMLRKLKLCYSWELLTSSAAAAFVACCRCDTSNFVLGLLLVVSCLLIFSHSNVVHWYCHFLPEALISYDEAKLGTAQVRCRELLGLFIRQSSFDYGLIPHAIWWIYCTACSTLTKVFRVVLGQDSDFARRESLLYIVANPCNLRLLSFLVNVLNKGSEPCLFLLEKGFTDTIAVQGFIKCIARVYQEFKLILLHHEAVLQSVPQSLQLLYTVLFLVRWRVYSATCSDWADRRGCTEEILAKLILLLLFLFQYFLELD